MKKILMFTAILVFAVCNITFAAPLAAQALSGEGLQIFGGTTAAEAANPGVLLGKMSKGVSFIANFTDQGYALATKHGSGTKAYGTAHDSTAIYFIEKGTTVLTGTDVSAAGNSAFATGWTTM